jgi:hypothetical protein
MLGLVFTLWKGTASVSFLGRMPAEMRKRLGVWQRIRRPPDTPRVALLVLVGVAVIAASFFLSLTIFKLLD